MRFLIFNADDFGYSTGINRGILDCHEKGVVTSASLTVMGRAVGEAVDISREHPELSIGLHWDVWGEDEREFDITDLAAVRREFETQLERFHHVMDRGPSHVDSHRHAHRRTPELMDLFRELVEPLRVPLRDDGKVRYVGNFYAQWEWKITDPTKVGLPQLQQWLREEVNEGWTEFSCHPGYVTPDWNATYFEERELEVETLTDPRLRRTIDDLGIQLASYADYLRHDRHADL